MSPREQAAAIAVPLYRPDPRYLRSLLDSLKTQSTSSGTPVDVHLVDDATPTDPTAWVTELIGERLPRATFRRNEQRQGMVGNWNTAVNDTSAPFVLLLSQDDEVGSGMIATLADALAEEPTASMAACGRTLIGPEGDASTERLHVNDRRNIFVRHDRYRLDGADVAALCLRNILAYGEPSAVLFRRRAFDAVGGFDSEFEHAADVDFTVRMAQVGPAIYLPAPYLRRRFHDDNLTRTHLRSGATLRDRERLYDRHRHLLTRADRRRVEAALVSRGVRDAVRAITWRRPSLVVQNMRSVGRHLGVPGPALAEHAREIVTGKNADQR